MITRRSSLFGLASLIAAPSLVRTESLMLLSVERTQSFIIPFSRAHGFGSIVPMARHDTLTIAPLHATIEGYMGNASPFWLFGGCSIEVPARETGEFHAARIVVDRAGAILRSALVPSSVPVDAQKARNDLADYAIRQMLGERA